MSDKTELKDKDLKKVSGGSQNTFEINGSNCPENLKWMNPGTCKTCSCIFWNGDMYYCSMGVHGSIH